MMVPAVVDELNCAIDLEDFLTTVTGQYGLESIEGEVAGHKCILLTRPSDPNESCAIHDECTIAVVSDDHTLVAKAIDRVYPFGHRYCTIFLENNQPAYVEEKLKGFPVVVSKYEGTHLITTEYSIHGDNKMPGYAGLSVAEWFMEMINIDCPMKGIDCLFDVSWASPIAWMFQITPDINNKHRMVLIAATDMDTGKELNRRQLDNIAEHYHISRPKSVKIYGKEQIADAVGELLLENPLIDEVIIQNEYSARAKYPISQETKLRTGVRGCSRSLKLIADCAMKNITLLDPTMQGVYNVLRDNLDQLTEEARVLHDTYSRSRTRYRYAKKVGGHPMAKVLFALQSGKIRSLKNINQALKPAEFINMIGSVDGYNLNKAIAKYKEDTCQPIK